MANSLSVQISVNSRVDNVTSTLSSTVTNQLTSSNVIIASANVNAAGWTQLSLGTLTDVQNIYVLNDNTVNATGTNNTTASYIAVATASNGGNQLAILPPGTGMNIPWSGSYNSLYGKVVSAAPFTNGVLQYVVNQS